MSFGRLQDTVAAIFALYLDVVKSFTQVLYVRLNRGKMAKMTDLPVEIIAKILTFLPVEDQAAMSQVCRRFNEASNVEYVWLRRCRQEFSVDTSSSDISSKEIYTKLLYQYGYLLGYWQPEISSYGGLLKIQYIDGKLLASELFPYSGSNIKRPLNRKAQFCIELNNDSKSEVHCIGCFQEVHRGKLIRLGKNRFSFDCQDPKSHYVMRDNLEGMDIEHALDVIDEALDASVYSGLRDDFQRRSEASRLMKQLARIQYKSCFKYNRVFLPKNRTNVPIQPGVFQGTYGAHGLEIIMLDYDGCLAKAVKVSGDPNVPAGKITFMAELDRGMVLTLDEQSSMMHLDSIKPVPTRFNSYADKRQPFKVPKECLRVPEECLEQFQNMPKTCIGRFCGSGQIAGHDFTNPSFTNGHWIIFDEDLFGFMWLDLLSLSMYSRIKEIR